MSPASDFQSWLYRLLAGQRHRSEEGSDLKSATVCGKPHPVPNIVLDTHVIPQKSTGHIPFPRLSLVTEPSACQTFLEAECGCSPKQNSTGHGDPACTADKSCTPLVYVYFLSSSCQYATVLFIKAERRQVAPTCESHAWLLNVHVDAYNKISSTLKCILEIMFELSISKSH